MDAGGSNRTLATGPNELVRTFALIVAVAAAIYVVLPALLAGADGR